jgi:hypothetical protein
MRPLHRRLATAALGVALAALVGVPAPAAPHPGRKAGNGLIAHLSAPTHRPTAGERWVIHITAHDRAGRRVHASVRYAYLYKGEVVARDVPKGNRHFVGSFHDRHLTWSKRTIALKLTFRAVVDSRLGQANLDYEVKVVR